MNDAIRRGMEAQLRTLHAAEAGGDARVGWKIGFNDPAAQVRMGLDAPLVGHLLRSRVVPCRGVCSLPPDARGMLEVEVCIELGADVPAGGDLDAARAAVARLGPALEIVDFSRSFEGVETILGHDIFQEAVVFGREGSGRSGASLDGVGARVTRNGEEVARGDLGLVPADLGEVVRHVADVLGAAGEALRAGERIIAGSLIKPLEIAAGDAVSADLGPLGRVEVTLARSP
jgi:2-keto-4-pentenoate hydratase